MNASPPPDTVAGSRTEPKIRPAATLALVRFGREGPQLLMGRRRRDLAFMPDCWVFPGGRVDRDDADARPIRGLPAATEERFARIAPNPPPEVCALAAVRETFEETGIVIGAPGSWRGPADPTWRAFEAAAAGPNLSDFAALAHAVTPPGRTRRFDTRFFFADAAQACLTPECAPISRGELEDVRWIGLKAAWYGTLAPITQVVLKEIEKRLKTEDPFADQSILCFDLASGSSRLERR